MRNFLILLAVLLATPSFSQTDKYKLTEKDTLITCGLTSRSEISGPFFDQHSPDFEDLVTAVFKASKLPSMPYSIFRTANPEYVRLGCHKYDELEYYTFFLYNLDSVMQFNVKSRSKYGLIAIIAHEVGHHAFNHFMNMPLKSTKHQELQADYFAGWTMAELNVPKSEVTKGIAVVAKDEHTGSGYPSRNERISTTLQGYNAGLKTQKFGPLAMLEAGKEPGYDWVKKWSRIIKAPGENVPLRDGVFSRASGNFILDDLGQLIYQVNEQNFVIARAIPSKDRDFRYVVFDNFFNYWLIDREGSIKNSALTEVVGKVDINTLAIPR